MIFRAQRRAKLSRMARSVNARKIFNVPNLISATRIALIPPLLAATFEHQGGVALGLFIVVIASDFADGFIARRQAYSSSVGALVDHGADAIFVVVMTTAYAWLGLLPAILPPLIALAFVQYVLDSRAHSGERLRSSRLGKWNGIGYFCVCGFALITYHFPLARSFGGALYWFGVALVISTVISIAQRARYYLRSSY